MRLNAVFRQEKIPQSLTALRNCDGGRYRTRTCDPLHVKRVGRFLPLAAQGFQGFFQQDSTEIIPCPVVFLSYGFSDYPSTILWLIGDQILDNHDTTHLE